MKQTFVEFLGAFEGNLKLEVAQERRRIFANGHIIDVYFSHSFTMKRHINSLFTFLKSEVQKTTKIRQSTLWFSQSRHCLEKWRKNSNLARNEHQTTHA